MCDFALARKLRGARTVELSEAAATAEERLLCTRDKLVHNLDIKEKPIGHFFIFLFYSILDIDVCILGSIHFLNLLLPLKQLGLCQ